jgi:hypothetical protein
MSDDAPWIVGFSEETTFYVSPEYFRDDQPFADFVVHEAAHVFHNCKRRTLGLPETRTREWLLDIVFAKRETFAYACEAYVSPARIAWPNDERSRPFARDPRLSDDSVDVPRRSASSGGARRGAPWVEGHPPPVRAHGGLRPVASHPVGPEAAGGRSCGACVLP